MTTAQQVLSCSFERWYPNLKAVSFRSRVVPLPKAFVDYLVQDGVYLTEDNSAVRLWFHIVFFAPIGRTLSRQCCELQLPKRVSPDQTALEDEYADWSEEDLSSESDRQFSRDCLRVFRCRDAHA